MNMEQFYAKGYEDRRDEVSFTPPGRVYPDQARIMYESGWRDAAADLAQYAVTKREAFFRAEDRMAA